MALDGRRATSEDSELVGEVVRIRNGTGEDKGVGVKCPVDVIGNQ